MEQGGRKERMMMLRLRRCITGVRGFGRLCSLSILHVHLPFRLMIPPHQCLPTVCFRAHRNMEGRRGGPQCYPAALASVPYGVVLVRVRVRCQVPT